MAHVDDALIDLQAEVKNSWSTISRAWDVLDSATCGLAWKQQDIKNTYENMAKIEEAGAQVRATIANYMDGIYRAVREIEALQ